MPTAQRWLAVGLQNWWFLWEGGGAVMDNTVILRFLYCRESTIFCEWLSADWVWHLGTFIKVWNMHHRKWHYISSRKAKWLRTGVEILLLFEKNQSVHLSAFLQWTNSRVDMELGLWSGKQERNSSRIWYSSESSHR
jgi:hypothetical protein